MSNAMPKVSVVLPISAAPQNLNRAIASVLKQNMPELELIVVATENSGYGVEEAVAAFSESDARVQFVRIDGADPTKATSVGMSMARAPWLAFQRDGDEWLVDRLSRQLAGAEKYGDHCYLIVGRLLQYMPIAKTRMRYWATATDSERLDPAIDIPDFPAFLQATLIRRSALVTMGAVFDPQGTVAENFDWARRLIAQGCAAAIPSGVAITYVSSGIKMPNPLIKWIREALKR